MTEYRTVFDAEVTFSNDGGLQAQRFRVDLPDPDISPEEIGRLFVASLDLLMTETATVSNVSIIEEAHKGTRGGPSDPRNAKKAPPSRLILPKRDSLAELASVRQASSTKSI